jgi:signal transduction histidine kinase
VTAEVRQKKHTTGEKVLQRRAAVGELAAGVVHETRNLMTAIYGFAQMARSRDDSPEMVARYVELIERESQRCLKLLDEFLQLSHARKEPSDLIGISEIVEAVRLLAFHQLATRRIRLDVEEGGAMPLVRGSRDDLEQVLLNLVLNAMHAMPEGGAVRIVVRGTPGSIEITVADTGAGVPHALREQIFEPFFSTRPRGEGTGLGLPLSRGIVEAHGGTLTLAPCEPGRGATFVISLPTADVES